MNPCGLAKLRELILYVAACSEGDPTFDKAKLNEILFYADLLAFRETGESITGQEYRKSLLGPIAPQVEPMLSTLASDGAVAIGLRQFWGRPQERPFALREADLGRFSGHEVATIDKAIRLFWCKSAQEAGEFSRRFLGWQVTADGETIPYETTLVDVSEPTAEDVAYAEVLVRAGR